MKTKRVIRKRLRAAAHLMDAEAFELQQVRARLLEGIAQGERAAEKGRTLTHAQAKRRMRKWLGRPKPGNGA